MRRFRTVFEPHQNSKNSSLGPQKIKKKQKIKSQSKVTIKWNMKNKSCCIIWVDPKIIWSWPQTLKIAYFFALKSQKEITLKLHKIKSKNWRRQRKHMLFCYMSRPKHILDHNLNPKKSQFLPLFSVNLSQPQLNSTSIQPQLNFN